MAELHISSLQHWLDSSPTPFHVVETAIAELKLKGFTEQESFATPLGNQSFMHVDGTLIAWRLGTDAGSFRIIGAHTDSPNLRIQQSPDFVSAGWSQLGVEIYGGVLLNSWLDRDLGIAGRVIDATQQSHLFNAALPLARVPQLAIHLDRDISERGLTLDRHQHMSPVWGLSSADFGSWLSSVTGVDNILAFDAHLYDLTPSSVLGVDQSMLASARLDNQVSCWAAVRALVSSTSANNSVIVVLNDHEEVGSESATGAAGPLLENLLSIIDTHHGLNEGQRLDRRRSSWCLSADNSHSVHPNYTERHDPRHAPRPNLGPAVKLNGNQRYATSARGAAHIRSVADDANVPLQTFMSRNNMPCGSTIGPITSTRLGIPAIDIGIPQLSMHSAREMCGVDDPIHLAQLATAFASR